MLPETRRFCAQTGNVKFQENEPEEPPELSSIGLYTLHEKLGDGMYGAVRRATHKVTKDQASTPRNFSISLVPYIRGGGGEDAVMLIMIYLPSPPPSRQNAFRLRGI